MNNTQFRRNKDLEPLNSSKNVFSKFDDETQKFQNQRYNNEYDDQSNERQRFTQTPTQKRQQEIEMPSISRTPIQKPDLTLLNQNNLPSSDQSILPNLTNKIMFISIAGMFIQVFNTIFVIFICGYRNICYASGIDMDQNLSTSIVVYFFLTLILSASAVFLCHHYQKSIISKLKIIMLIYAVSQFFVSLSSWIFISQVDTIKTKNTYEKLQPLSKLFYNNNYEQFKDEITYNYQLTGIYHFICSILTLIQVIILWFFDNNLPQNWVPQPKIRLYLENESIQKESYYDQCQRQIHELEDKIKSRDRQIYRSRIANQQIRTSGQQLS